MKPPAFWKFIIAEILTALGAVGFVYWVYREIAEGRGDHYYFTGFGMKFTPIGVAILIFGLFMALFVGLYINYRSKADERNFVKKYSHRIKCNKNK